MKKGDLGDNMYISFQGTLGVYLNDNLEESPIALIQPFKCVGERALERDGDRRTATIVAMDPGETITLALEKKDFYTLVAVSLYIIIMFYRDN
jgi:CRP-like cAMP-binding protein